MNKLYIDVTQLTKWQGKLTGIPRVMYELSKRYDTSEEVQFVVWNNEQQNFSIVGNSFLKRNEKTHEKTAFEKNTKKSLKGLIPARIRRRVPRERLRSVKNILQSGSTTSAEPIFKNGNKLLVLWGEWESGAYIESLLKAKKEGIELIQVAYDMLPIITPQYSGHSTESLTNYATKIYPICNLILSISQNTKLDIEKWLKVNNLIVPKIEVFRLGDDFELLKPVKPDYTFFESNKKFLLMVGTVEARKNHTLMYYVYKLAVQKKVELPDLIVVGRRGWLTDDIYELITNDPETKSKVHFLHNCTDEELSWLYSHCMFTLYPSLYEGWGLPIAESLQYGVPCIASNTSSMPEISKIGVKYVSPTSTNDFLDSITSLLDETNLVELKKEAGKYVPATWDQTFDQVKNAVKALDE